MSDNDTIENETTVRSVVRAVSLLKHLMAATKPLSLNELSESTQVHPSTAYRLMQTLEEEKFVFRDPDTKRYTLGANMIFQTPGQQSAYALTNLAVPILESLSQEIGEGVSMAILRGYHAMVIAKASSHRNVDLTLKSGVILPLHGTALGKAILAYLEPAEFEKIIAHEGLKPGTENTITDIDQLQEELSSIRDRGYSTDYEEWEIGIRCVGVPVFSGDRRVLGAMSVSGPSGRMDESRLTEIAKKLMNGAEKLSSKL